MNLIFKNLNLILVFINLFLFFNSYNLICKANQCWRNPFTFNLKKTNSLESYQYAFIATEKNGNRSANACAYININNQQRKICVGDKLNEGTIKEIRPEGIVICKGDNCQQFISFK